MGDTFDVAEIERLLATCHHGDLITKAPGHLRSLLSRVRALEAKADAEMLRVKACEHIAKGDEGWEKLRDECPSTAAVARLRDRVRALEAALREPTEAMLSAGDSAIPRAEADASGHRMMGREVALEAWKAMAEVLLANPRAALKDPS